MPGVDALDVKSRCCWYLRVNAASTRCRYSMLVLDPGVDAVIAGLGSLDGLGCSV